MQLWERWLALDREHDLTTPATATAALWGDVEPGDEQRIQAMWSEPGLLTLWVEAVHALRSVAARLKRRRGREADIAPRRADDVFQDYLLHLRPVLTRDVDKDGNTRPITAATFKGVRIVHLKETLPQKPGRSWTTEPGLFSTGPTCFEHIWSEVFGSMVFDDFAPVCSECGKPLDLTPKGRRPRAGMCKTCRWNRWYKRQPKSKLRESWREAKKAARAKGE